MTKKEKRAINRADRKLHRTFVKKYRKGTLDGTDPVELKVRRLARLVAVRFSCRDQESDLEQETIASLGTKSKFAGKCSLNTYILKMLKNSAIKLTLPIITGQFSYESTDDEGKAVRKRRRFVAQSLEADAESEFAAPLIDTLANEPSSGLANRALEKIAEDEFMEEVMTRPEIQQLVIEIILESESAMTDRKIAEKLSDRLDRTVSRHEVQKILKRLRPLVEKSLWVS